MEVVEAVEKDGRDGLKTLKVRSKSSFSQGTPAVGTPQLFLLRVAVEEVLLVGEGV